jgi:multicomponent Na+:H+ antiporter subunit G
VIPLLLNVVALLGFSVGTFFAVVAAIGILRFEDIYLRLQAATKGVTLGLIGLTLGAVCREAALGGVGGSVIVKAVLIVALQFVAAPVAAHAMARAAWRTNAPKSPRTIADEPTGVE